MQLKVREKAKKWAMGQDFWSKEILLDVFKF